MHHLKKNMKSNCTITETLLSIIPFLLFGTEWLFSIYSDSIIIRDILFVLALFSMFFLLGIGWIKGFPKWTIPSISFCIIFSLLFTNVSSPSFGRHEIWGLWALLPLGLTLIISIILNPTLRPIHNLSQMIKQEKNIIIFAFYGLLPILFPIAFDEINPISIAPFVFILTILTVISVIIYLRSSRQIVRTLTSIIGVVVTITIAIIVAISHANDIIIR
jgi:hypothetical protein